MHASGGRGKRKGLGGGTRTRAGHAGPRDGVDLVGASDPGAGGVLTGSVQRGAVAKVRERGALVGDGNGTDDDGVALVVDDGRAGAAQACIALLVSGRDGEVDSVLVGLSDGLVEGLRGLEGSEGHGGHRAGKVSDILALLVVSHHPVDSG